MRAHTVPEGIHVQDNEEYNPRTDMLYLDVGLQQLKVSMQEEEINDILLPLTLTNHSRLCDHVSQLTNGVLALLVCIAIRWSA